MALSSNFIHAASGARAPLLREVVALRLGGDAALNRAAQLRTRKTRERYFFG